MYYNLRSTYWANMFLRKPTINANIMEKMLARKAPDIIKFLKFLKTNSAILL